MVEKIKHYRKVLSDHNTPKKERAAPPPFLFLVHFVEDVHQPLHVGDNHDRGGNQTQVQYFSDPTATNLHRVWDSQILDDASRDDRKWVAMIEPLLTPENIAAWSKGTVEDWTDESSARRQESLLLPRGFRPPPSATAPVSAANTPSPPADHPPVLPRPACDLQTS